ncbi:MAG: L-aspartate oxidase [Cyclobacteriaceae bacterium]|nr:L-aspartate oxidase [Cyclobacteriaceae bacterium]
MRVDLLIIGSGIAGLFTALKAARLNPEAKILVVTKADANESNTKYAQGGIAVVLDKVTDSIDKHIEDTLRAGDGFCDEKIVKIVVEEGIDRFHELLEVGARFEKGDSGEFVLGKEGGHTANRVAHHKDMTGFEIERALLEGVKAQRNIEVKTHYFVIDLITDHHIARKKIDLKSEITCYGGYLLNRNTGNIEKIEAKTTVLATGGVGNVYKYTTNPSVATGDGVALAYRAKALISDMEFIQFHPTAFYEEKEGHRFLITEAIRGAGARLKKTNGEYFMKKYDPREELASRDIVARAIDSELKISGDDYVLLDCGNIGKEKFKQKFPTILDKCTSTGIDPFESGIPVVPAAHYLCGGIVADEKGRTNIRSLLAVGECARTGLHGANRLASNSLLEALVFAHRCAETFNESLSNRTFRDDIPEWHDEGLSIPGENILIRHFRKEVQSVMSDFVGIVRSNKRLSIASKKLDLLYSEINELYRISKLSIELGELRNLVNVAYLIIEQSKLRKENRGVFYNRDLD